MKLILQNCIVFFPLLLFGQSKDCNVIYEAAPIFQCFLTPSQRINDTTIAYMTQNCNQIIFDSTVNGQWKVYSYDSLNLIENATIRKGMRDGLCLTYFLNGQVSTEANYLKGMLNGKYTAYYDNGKVYMKGYYRKNLFSGNTFQYWDNGNIAKQMLYKNGSCLIIKNEKYFDEEGKPTNWEYYSKHWYDCK